MLRARRAASSPLPRTLSPNAGASLKHVIRTRMFLTHVEDWEVVGRVHGEFFGQIRPAATMVVVARLLNPAWRIEMEMDAVIPGEAREAEDGTPTDW